MVRHQKADKSYWLLPGGGVQYGETMAQALEREIFEETGLVSRIGKLWLVCESIDPLGRRHVVNMCFLAESVSGELQASCDPRVVEAKYLTADQVRGVTMHPDLRAPLAELLEHGFDGETKFLGDVWKD